MYVCVGVHRYTREAGVRSLERKIGAICRAVAVKVAEGHKMSKQESSSHQQGQLAGERAACCAVSTTDCIHVSVILKRKTKVYFQNPQNNLTKVIIERVEL